MDRVYLDYAATTPLDPLVAQEMLKVMENDFGNPSSIYAEGRRSRSLIEGARKMVAKMIHASIGEIFFTSGGTESNNMALKCAVRDLGVKRIISSPTEHHCILHSLDRLKDDHQVTVEYLAVDKKGNPDLNQLDQLLGASQEKTLVSLMHSNNEVGTMIDLNQVSVICDQHGAFFHTDSVQTMGYFPIDVNQTKISFLSGSAHKFYGPKGVGFIYINNDNIIKPFVDGGSQERNMRAGTENIYGIIGLAKALELAYEQLDERKSHTEAIRDYMADQLIQHFDDVRINGGFRENGHYKVLSVSFPPSSKTDLLLLNLDIAGISVSGGSACSSGVDTGSHVMNALQETPGRKTIRFSFSHHNTIKDIDYVIGQLKVCLPDRVLAT